MKKYSVKELSNLIINNAKVLRFIDESLLTYDVLIKVVQSSKPHKVSKFGKYFPIEKFTDEEIVNYINALKVLPFELNIDKYSKFNLVDKLKIAHNLGIGCEKIAKIINQSNATDEEIYSICDDIPLVLDNLNIDKLSENTLSKLLSSIESVSLDKKYINERNMTHRIIHDIIYYEHEDTIDYIKPEWFSEENFNELAKERGDLDFENDSLMREAFKHSKQVVDEIINSELISQYDLRCLPKDVVTIDIVNKWLLTIYNTTCTNFKVHECSRRNVIAVQLFGNWRFIVGCQSLITKEKFIDRINNNNGGLEKNPYREEYLKVLENY